MEGSRPLSAGWRTKRSRAFMARSIFLKHGMPASSIIRTAGSKSCPELRHATIGFVVPLKARIVTFGIGILVEDVLLVPLAGRKILHEGRRRDVRRHEAIDVLVGEHRLEAFAVVRRVRERRRVDGIVDVDDVGGKSLAGASRPSRRRIARAQRAERVRRDGAFESRVAEYARPASRAARLPSRSVNTLIVSSTSSRVSGMMTPASAQQPVHDLEVPRHRGGVRGDGRRAGLRLPRLVENDALSLADDLADDGEETLAVVGLEPLEVEARRDRCRDRP